MLNRKILMLSLLFCIVTFIITTAYLSNSTSIQQKKEELIPIVVAKVAIGQRAIITADLIEIKNIPREYVLPGAISKLDMVSGKITVSQLVPGEQITAIKISERNPRQGLSVLIPANKRAVSVEVDASASIAGLVKPGDMVDIACSLPDLDRTITILQNVPVLAIDQQMDTNTTDAGKINRTVIATFGLDLENAEKLIQAAQKGQLKLLLRPVNDNSQVYSWGANTSKLMPYSGKSTYTEGTRIRIIRGTEITNKTL